jgi:hypothetical protein
VNVNIYSSLTKPDDHPELNMNPANGSQAPGLDGGPAPQTSGEHQIAVFSAAVLLAVMAAHGEDNRDFALRADVTEKTVTGAVNGTCPSWALPDAEFTALADTVKKLSSCPVFETAAACDLLLTCVLNGERCMATDVLTEPCSRDLARAMLRLVVREAEPPLLPADLLALLREQATALASSGSPDAWVGSEILAGFSGRQS